MGVYIKGMDMPKYCNECRFCWDSIGERFCFLNGHIMFDINSGIEKHPDCPLVEVPKHGRLIDADELKANMESATADLATVLPKAYVDIAADLTMAFMQDIDETPTVIDAEE